MTPLPKRLEISFERVREGFAHSYCLKESGSGELDKPLGEVFGHQGGHVLADELVRRYNRYNDAITALADLVNCPDYRGIKTLQMSKARALVFRDGIKITEKE